MAPDLDLIDELRRVGLNAGLAAVGVTSTDPFVEARVTIEHRKAADLHGGMQFTFRNPSRSTEPDRILSDARSLVVGGWRYEVGEEPRPAGEPVGSVAAYARIDQYHDLRKALETIAECLRGQGHSARVVADDNALVDRAAAVRAGLGWQGKNTNLLMPGRGSWFVLGAVVTDAELPHGEAVTDECGTCSRCLTGCPTGALIAPGVLDARRCLAWLVQAPGEIPRQFRTAMHDRMYGCDDCQEVCPPNRRLAPDESSPGTTTGSGQWVKLLEVLDADDEGVMRIAGHWYVAKRDPRFLRRNALIGIGNVGSATDQRVISILDRYVQGDDDLLASHAVWAARKLGLGCLVANATPGPLVDAELAAAAP